MAVSSPARIIEEGRQKLVETKTSTEESSYNVIKLLK